MIHTFFEERCVIDMILIIQIACLYPHHIETRKYLHNLWFNCWRVWRVLIKYLINQFRAHKNDAVMLSKLLQVYYMWHSTKKDINIPVIFFTSDNSSSHSFFSFFITLDNFTVKTCSLGGFFQCRKSFEAIFISILFI